MGLMHPYGSPVVTQTPKSCDSLSYRNTQIHQMYVKKSCMFASIHTAVGMSEDPGVPVVIRWV